ncbi:ropporin-1-like protein isoform X2 [Belonocnema kinseyi]|uniref:ropporin-1-like protein isoform X2 n=1 Tax=Belonocnema kinseyi TaxID=2817044 RepID=UPI00143E012A|nr:ropporin-1-like protein isoform X2 [Belonocnema kinseyi]
MPLVEQSNYCSQQINVPPRLPMILKQFCKAAIRTQPYDLLKWSSAYFRALAEGDEPPAKVRLEYPPPSTVSGLTLGFLKVLLRQLGDYNKVVPVETLLRRWDCLCLDRKDLNLIMMIGKFRRKCQVKKFLAIAVGLLASSIFETMVMICELFTHEPDGGSAMIPVSLFMELYGFLAGLRCDGTKREPDEDPLTCTIFDESEQGNLCPTSNDCTENNNKPKDSSVSLTSQDTETDVNLELESISQEDDESFTKSDKEKKTEALEKIDTSGRQSEEHLSKAENSETERIESSKIEDHQNNNLNELSNENSVKAENFRDKSSQESGTESQNTNDRRMIESRGEKVKMKINDPALFKYHQNIPGIGPRLLAEEVACVAIWMSECARRQEGMVGPRNLRHFQCPPLDRQQILQLQNL